MGVKYTQCLLISVLFVYIFINYCYAEPYDIIGVVEDVSANVTNVCQLKGCNCTPAQSNKWINVNCTFNSKQTVDLRREFLPSNIKELSIVGGKRINFNQQVFSSLLDPWRLRLENVDIIVFKTHFFNNIVINFLLQIIDCNKLVFEKEAFSSDGPVVVEVSKCTNVNVESQAFNFLHNATFQDILNLELAESAFIIKHKNVGYHGPVTTIRFRNVIIPTIPKDTFKSSLAEVSFHNSKISNILSESFNGISISAIIIKNCVLDTIYTAAFSERTLLTKLEIAYSKLHVIYPNALLSATTNLSIQHSKITTMHSGAFNSTIARTIFNNNTIGTFHSKGFILHDWNQINIENNKFKNIHADCLEIPFKYSTCQEPCEITFIGNEIAKMESGALKFITEMPSTVKSYFKNNSFNYTCHCDIEEWLKDILGAEDPYFSEYNYCWVDRILAKCHEIPEGKVIMQNFTDYMCKDGKDVITCKVLEDDSNVLNDEFKEEGQDTSKVILGLVLGLVLLIAVCATILILLIHGGLWLKRKGYCVKFKNIHPYRVEEESTEVEDIMVTVEKNVENNLPEELSQELLQALREKLEDPLTYNEAREMIERLYDHFIIEDSYTNNNRQEEETHLYEELGNLNRPQNQENVDDKPARPFSFLRLIEERFNLVPNEQQNKTVLINEYSEPTDAEVHLYSEVSQNKEGKQNEINEGLIQINEIGSSTQKSNGFNSIRSNKSIRSNGTATQRSNGSCKMASRPLPDKPRLDPGEGPSTQF